MKSMKPFMALLLGSALCIGEAIGVSASEKTEANGCVADVAYMDDGNEDHLLDVFGTEGGTEKPVIIEVHGGGFIGGSKSTNTAHSEYLAEKGFAVVTPNYTHMPDGNFKTVIQELFTVMDWVSVHADEYGFDTGHIFMDGDSAGGCYVLLSALTLHSEELQDYYEVQAPDYEMAGYTLSCPKVDIPVMAEDLEGEGPNAFTAQAIGEDILLDEETISHADIYSLIDPETFPAVYFLTTPTDNILYEESVQLDEFLTEKGIAHTYKVYEGSENEIGHVFNITKVEYAESQQANDDLAEYLWGLCG